jgi:hypothetical protein
VHRILEKLTFANVMSMTAVFIALGGSAVAATLAKNSVGARQIKTNAVGASEVKRNAVGTSEIKTNGVRAAEIGANSVGGGELADNSVAGGDVQDNSLGSNDVAGLNSGDVDDNSLTGGDILDGSLKSEDVAPGTFLGGTVTVAYAIAPAGLAVNTSASYDVLFRRGRSPSGAARAAARPTPSTRAPRRRGRLEPAAASRPPARASTAGGRPW